MLHNRRVRRWLICGIAATGFAFDTYELLMLPLIVRPALLTLTTAAPGSPAFERWVGAPLDGASVDRLARE